MRKRSFDAAKVGKFSICTNNFRNKFQNKIYKGECLDLEEGYILFVYLFYRRKEPMPTILFAGHSFFLLGLLQCLECLLVPCLHRASHEQFAARRRGACSAPAGNMLGVGFPCARRTGWGRGWMSLLGEWALEPCRRGLFRWLRGREGKEGLDGGERRRNTG